MRMAAIAMLAALIAGGAMAQTVSKPAVTKPHSGAPATSTPAAARMLLNGPARFHHPAMVQLDGGRSDLKELDALVDLLIDGLQARG